MSGFVRLKPRQLPRGIPQDRVDEMTLIGRLQFRGSDRWSPIYVSYYGSGMGEDIPPFGVMVVDYGHDDVGSVKRRWIGTEEDVIRGALRHLQKWVTERPQDRIEIVEGYAGMIEQ